VRAGWDRIREREGNGVARRKDSRGCRKGEAGEKEPSLIFEELKA